jgi:predicted membrane-bound spermidine synthase
VLWVRLLAHVVGGGLHAFATMLASFLTGIAVGSALASRLATTMKRATRGFASAQLGIALLSLLAFASLSAIPDLAAALRGQGYPELLGDVVISMSTLFPAALLIGATFPLAVRILARDEHDAGLATAQVYAANTFGSIVGSLGAGFFVIPLLGFAGALASFAATNLAIAAFTSLVGESRRPLFAALAGAGGLLLLVAQPPTPWNVLQSSSLTLEARDDLDAIEYFGVGRSATVLMFSEHGHYHLRTDGLPEASIDPPGVWHNRWVLSRWLAALPVLARPDARSVLVVGLGGGEAVVSMPASVERIDVVELEPEVVAANRAIASRRWRDPLSDPRVHVHENDARNALLLTDSRFDAIVSQPSHPWSPGAAHLYTREFFELARSRLSSGGVLVQWIPLTYVDEALFRSVLVSLGSVFPNVRVYCPAPYSAALFVASGEALDMEANSARAIARSPAEYAGMGLGVEPDVRVALLLDEAGARSLGRDALLNSDGHNRLETRSPWVRERALGSGLHPFFDSMDPLVESFSGRRDAFYLLRELHPRRARRLAEALTDRIDRRVASAVLDARTRQAVDARPRLEGILRARPEHREARSALLRVTSQASLPEPLDDFEHTVVTGWRARTEGAWDALSALETELLALPRTHPLARDAARLRIEWRLSTKSPDRAREAIEIVDQSFRYHPEPGDLLLRARASTLAGQPAAALDTLSVFAQRIGPRNPERQRLAAAGLELAESIAAAQSHEALRSHVLSELVAKRGPR